MWEKIFSGFGIVALLIAMTLGGVIGGEFGDRLLETSFSSSKPSPRETERQMTKALEDAANQINERGPTMADENTRLDRASLGPGMRFIYHYTFVHRTSHDIDANWLRTDLAPVVKSKVCLSSKMKPSLEFGVKYVYAYSGNDGSEITRFEVSDLDCSTGNEPRYASGNN
jgi:hypothetical protein